MSESMYARAAEPAYPIRIESADGALIDRCANVESAESVLYGDLDSHDGLARRVLAPAGLVRQLQHAAEINADCWSIPLDDVVNVDSPHDDRVSAAGYRCPRCRSLEVDAPRGYRLARCRSCSVAFDTMGDDDPGSPWPADLLDGAAEEYLAACSAGARVETLESFAYLVGRLGYRLDTDSASTCAAGFYANRLNDRHYLAFGVSYTDIRTGLGFANVGADRSNLEALQDLRLNVAILHQGAYVES